MTISLEFHAQLYYLSKKLETNTFSVRKYIISWAELKEMLEEVFLSQEKKWYQRKFEIL
jgi:hypothetical protein